MAQRCGLCGKTERQHGGRACFDMGTEVRAIARERVGSVPAAKVITPKTKKRPKKLVAWLRLLKEDGLE